jgi:hypothetical protein
VFFYLFVNVVARAGRVARDVFGPADGGAFTRAETRRSLVIVRADFEDLLFADA